MKLLSYYNQEKHLAGIQTDKGVIPLSLVKELSGLDIGERIDTFIESDHFNDVKDLLPNIEKKLTQSDYLDYDALELASPIRNPEKIICVGLNYLDHVSEGPDLDVPEEPVLFNKFNNTLAANEEAIPLPIDGNQVDYEGELVIVMGKQASKVTEDKALDYVFGYTIGNDLSVRDLQFRSGQWLLGKSIDKFAPVGPIIVTSDSINPNNLDIMTQRNGRVVQKSNTDKMIFNCSRIISYISNYFTIQPGDLIFTGTPEGVILGYEPDEQEWLSSGDQIDITIENIGTLSNRIQ